jgi:hypothetical protein
MNIIQGHPGWLYLLLGLISEFLGMAGLLMFYQLTLGAGQDMTTNQNLAVQSAVFIVVFIPLGIVFFLHGFRRFAIERAAFHQPAPLSTQQLNAILQQKLNFTTEDLLINEQGYLSESQIQRYSINFEIMRRNSGCGMVMICLIVLFLASMTFLTEMRHFPDAVLSMSVVMGIMVIVPGIFLMYSYRAIQHFPNGQIYYVEGKAYLRMRPRRGNRYFTYILTIGRKTFYIQPQELEGFWNGAYYRVYCYPLLTTPISGEALDRL